MGLIRKHQPDGKSRRSSDDPYQELSQHFLTEFRGHGPGSAHGARGSALARMERQVPSLRNVLQWTIEKGHTDLALELAARSRHCFQFAGRASDALAFLEAGLAMPNASDELRMMALIEEARCRILFGDFERARLSLNEAFALSEVVGNPALSAEAYCVLGLLGNARLQFRASCKFLKRGLAVLQGAGLQQFQAELMALLGINAMERKNLAEARDWFSRARSMAEELDDYWQLALALHHLALAEYDLNGSEWPYFFHESIENFRRVGDEPGESWVLCSMSEHMLWCGQTEVAREAIEQSFRLRRKARDRGGMMECERILGLIEAEERNYPAALAHLAKATRMCYESGWTMGFCECLELISVVEWRNERPSRAVLIAAAAKSTRQGRETPGTARQEKYIPFLQRIESIADEPEMREVWERGSRLSPRATLKELNG